MERIVTMVDVDWSSDDSQVFLNPKLDAKLSERIQTQVGALDLHSMLWVSSSGTESSDQGFKLVGIPKESFLNQARLVCQFLAIDKNDIWINPIPKFHVGGLGIDARCFVSGAKEVLFGAWNPELFVEESNLLTATIASLVPTQVYDLVKKNLEAPTTLKTLLVGGGHLDEETYKRAWELGWPCLPSYGMSESSAMVASVPFPPRVEHSSCIYFPIPGVQLYQGKDRWILQAPGLFTHWLWITETGYNLLERPSVFELDDRLESFGEGFKVLARESEMVKVLGESVNLFELEGKINKKFGTSGVVATRVHPRKGYDFFFVIKGCERTKLSIEEVNEMLLPFEKICKIVSIEKIPTNELGKIKRAEINRLLSQLA